MTDDDLIDATAEYFGMNPDDVTRTDVEAYIVARQYEEAERKVRT